MKAEVSSKTDKDTECTRKFLIASITNSFKHLKGGKASGVDDLAAEHFLYAHRHIYVYLSLLFNSFMYHGYLPAEFIKTAIVPIIKCKTENSSDKNNYRPIAFLNACSKIFELCLVEIIKVYLDTHDNQFGFKKQHSTDMCIFTLKSVIKYYTQQSTPVYSCFLDASKAFDRVNYWKLFNMLIVRKVPLLIARMFIFGIVNRKCALNGANLHLAFSLFQLVLGKVAFCLRVYLLYTLMIYQSIHMMQDRDAL